MQEDEMNLPKLQLDSINEKHEWDR
jgi:hypothetical protein